MKMIVHQVQSGYLEEYFYRGEGNANLVISLPLKRSVLRFRKINTTNIPRFDVGRKRIKYEWKFFNEFISKYMGTFVTEPEIIQCHPRDFEHWQERVEAYRPEHRKQKSLYEDFAIKLPNYTQLPEHLDVDKEKSTFCIEIKPKQGFTPESDQYLQCCSYCINQFYKMEKKKIEKSSSYCPCDLFSGDRIRTEHAISSLLESPQNNMILFENESIIWGEGHNRHNLDEVLRKLFINGSREDNGALRNLLCYLIIEALFRKFPIDDITKEFRNSLSKPQNPVRTKHHDESIPHDIDEITQKIKRLGKSCDFFINNLPEGSVLECLLSMQRLHFTSTNYVYELFSKYSSLLNEEIVYFQHKTNDMNSNDILILRKYLLFSIARDCSILIAFREVDRQRASQVPQEHLIVLPNDKRTFVFNIGLADLDPKSLKCIENHYQSIINGLTAIRNHPNIVDTCTEQK